MWPTRPLQSLMSKPIQYGIVQTGDLEHDGTPCVRVVDLTRSRLSIDEVVRVSAKIHNRYLKTMLGKHDLLFALRGEIGTVREVPDDLVGANIHRGVARLAIEPQVANHRYVLHALQAPVTRAAIAFRTNGSALRELPIAQLRRLPVAVPPLEVQERIGRALDNWHNLLGGLSDLLDAKHRFKRALAQELLAGQRAEDGDTPRWPLRVLGDLMHESRHRASTGAHAKKLTVKLYGRGVVPKLDQRPGSPNTQYYRRQAGQFVYSKLDFLNGAFGIIPKELDGFETTLDLPTFDLSEEVYGPWLLHLFSWSDFYMQHVGLANGGRKARRVNPSELLKLRIPVPPMEDQRQIADALGKLDQEIALLKRLRNAYRQQWQAIVGGLLAGDLRLESA